MRGIMRGVMRGIMRGIMRQLPYYRSKFLYYMSHFLHYRSHMASGNMGQPGNMEHAAEAIPGGGTEVHCLKLPGPRKVARAVVAHNPRITSRIIFVAPHTDYGHLHL